MCRFLASSGHGRRRHSFVPNLRLPSNIVLRAATAVLAGVAIASRAEAPDYVFEPYGEQGVRVAQFSASVEKLKDGSSEQAQSLAVGGTPTERWFTAAYAAWYRDAGEKLRFDNIYLVNHLALAPAGAWPLDVGAYLEIQRPQDRSEGYAFLWGPTFQFDTSSLQVNANVWLQRTIHAENASPTVLVYQWQAKGLVGPHLELGAQSFGTLGPWLRWLPAHEQEHNIGPAAFAKWRLNDGRVLRADAAVLAGITTESPRITLRIRTQLEF